MFSALLVAVCLPLAACGGASSRAAPDSERVPTEAAASITRPTIVQPGQGGPGSVTVTATEPVAFSGYVDTPVTCTTTRGLYSADASSATIAGYTVSFKVSALRYTGPGEYQTTVVITLVQPDGATTTVPAAPKIPASITETGGSFSINQTGTDGRTLALSLTWGCSA